MSKYDLGSDRRHLDLALSVSDSGGGARSRDRSGGRSGDRSGGRSRSSPLTGDRRGSSLISMIDDEQRLGESSKNVCR